MMMIKMTKILNNDKDDNNDDDKNKYAKLRKAAMLAQVPYYILVNKDIIGKWKRKDPSHYSDA